uniref:ATP-binding cassette, sub-family D member 3 n=1 Tax=Mus musculus TaxID=10090 RepID=A0A0G2JGA4_MOUSE
MAAFSKYLTARNTSLAGAAFLLLCLLHKRRRALGLHGKKERKSELWWTKCFYQGSHRS